MTTPPPLSRPPGAASPSTRSGAPSVRRDPAALILCAGLLLAAAGSAQAWVVDQQSTVNLNGATNYASVAEVLKLPVVDIPPQSIPFGGTGYGVGLEAGIGGHADIDARIWAAYKNRLQIASKASARTVMFTPNPDPVVGDPFFLVNSIDSLGVQKLTIQSNDLTAGAALDVDVGGWAKAKACLGLCVEAGLELGVDWAVPLASVNNQGLKVFGTSVDQSLPYEYSGYGGLVKAEAGLPTFYKEFNNLAPGASATLLPKQESLLSLKMDVAELIARAASLPPLQGDLYGFGYEILSLDVGAGLDLKHAFHFSPLDLHTVYQFSSPVQMFDTATSSWGAATTQILLADGQSAQLRSTEAASIGVTSYHKMDYRVDYDFDLVVNADVDLSALELHGFGLSLGPLLDPPAWEINLASFDLASGSTSGVIGAYGETSAITFKPQKVIPAGEGQPGIVIDICATLPEGCDHTAYVTEKLPFGSIFQQTTRRVTNFGADGCNADTHIDCDFDAEFVPLVTQSRPFVGEPYGRDFDDIIAWLEELGVTLPDSGGVTEYAGDFQALEDFLTAPALVEAEASSPERMLAALAALGFDPDNPFPPRPPLTGAPPLTEPVTEAFSGTIAFVVAEPSGFALLAIAGVAFFAQRRCRQRFGCGAAASQTRSRNSFQADATTS